MKIEKTPIEGLLVFEPKVFGDDRGYFFESYREEILKNAGVDTVFIQENESKSIRGVIRGLHYQLNPHAQSKLVRVIEGRVYDVAVDLRKNSPTFGKWFGIELSSENKKQFLIPRGFAHGFSVLSETAVFCYKCDNYYNPESERGILYNDPSLNIDWLIPESEIIVSAKDCENKLFNDAEFNFD